MVEVARYFLDFTQKESCGKCTLCRIGTKQMLEILEDITKGQGKMEDLETLEELKERSGREYVSADLIAGIYAALGDDDRAMEWLERAYDEHCWGLIWIMVAPEYDALRSDQRFQDLVRRMDFPQ